MQIMARVIERGTEMEKAKDLKARLALIILVSGLWLVAGELFM